MKYSRDYTAAHGNTGVARHSAHFAGADAGFLCAPACLNDRDKVEWRDPDRFIVRGVRDAVVSFKPSATISILKPDERRFILADNSDEDLFAQYKKRSEQKMKFVVIFLAVALLLVLYFLVYG
ncbi:MAG: hypothetical protein ACYCY7_05060 [Gallionella sp.]